MHNAGEIQEDHHRHHLPIQTGCFESNNVTTKQEEGHNDSNNAIGPNTGHYRTCK
jgi:hypothetical protein